ncbi:MAG: hypothetical protein HUJ96_02820 [Marinilabiliaceae bacterium]|nr:hypothetical protein [Marinilabiliaceae bacterium]
MESVNEEKKQWGGKREGAGRKRVRGKSYAFRSVPETENILEQTDRKTDYINAAILYYYEHNGVK